jgi:type II secretory pathway predicted ATPase ExeA
MTIPRTSPPSKRPSIYSDFDEAKARLLAAIHRGPFYGILTGATGTAKTALLRRVAGLCDRHLYQVHYLASSQASSPGFVRFLTDVLHLTPRRTHTETLRSLCQMLRTLPFRLVIFIDEAHLLPVETLQEARILAESDLDSPPLFSVLFAGLPDLKAKLEDPVLFPLKRRLSLRLELNGLKKDEVLPFLASRLDETKAGRLSPEVLAAVFERARGIPALLESLAALCLESVPGRDPVTMESVQEILESWDIT